MVVAGWITRKTLSETQTGSGPGDDQAVRGWNTSTEGAFEPTVVGNPADGEGDQFAVDNPAGPVEATGYRGWVERVYPYKQAWIFAGKVAVRSVDRVVRVGLIIVIVAIGK